MFYRCKNVINMQHVGGETGIDANENAYSKTDETCCLNSVNCNGDVLTPKRELRCNKCNKKCNCFYLMIIVTEIQRRNL